MSTAGTTLNDRIRMEEVITTIPEPVQTPIREITKSNRMNAGVIALMDREREIGDSVKAILAGALMYQASREHLNAALDKSWAATKAPSEVEEVIVGAGVHAAIYTAARARKAAREGKPYIRPLVIDAGTRAGGAFGVTSTPSWFLNSRNRAGSQGAPSDGGALNLIPGAPIQPFDITYAEYPTNADMGDVIRLTHGFYSSVYPNVRVNSIETVARFEPDTKFELLDDNGAIITRARRVILATGLGETNNPFRSDIRTSDRVLDYWEFMRLMDSPFPLRGMRKVAVIGQGDGGKTVIETLLGQGPQAGMSTPSMDWVERIDWYGIGNTMNELDFCEQNRGRYRGIGRALRKNAYGQRLQPMDQANYVDPFTDAVYVDGLPYDYVVLATGFSNRGIRPTGDYRFESYAPQGTTLARRATNDNQQVDEWGVFKIGPAAELGLSSSEQMLADITNIPENSTAIFRYAPRTSTLADSFPVSEGPIVPLKPKRVRTPARPGTKVISYQGFTVGTRVEGYFGTGVVVTRPSKDNYGSSTKDSKDIPVQLDNETSGGVYGNGIFSTEASELTRIKS